MYLIPYDRGYYDGIKFAMLRLHEWKSEQDVTRALEAQKANQAYDPEDYIKGFGDGAMDRFTGKTGDYTESEVHYAL